MKPEEGNYSILFDSNRNYALDAMNGGTSAGTPLQLYERNNSAAQIFRLEYVDGYWFRLVHNASGLVVNVQNGDDCNDARLWLYPYDGTAACHFRLMRVENAYLLQNQIGGMRVLDLHDGNAFNGAIVHLWDLHSGYAAKWQLTKQSSSSVPSSSLLSANLSRVNHIKQENDHCCKSTAVAMALRIISGKNSYYTSTFETNNGCMSIDGKLYTGSDGRTYRATYKYDYHIGSLSEVNDQINSALSRGLPIVVCVKKSNSTIRHHFVVVVGRNSSGELICVDPAQQEYGAAMSNATHTFSSLRYSLGDSTGHYSYVSWAPLS